MKVGGSTPRVGRRLGNFRRVIRVEPDSAPSGTVSGEHMQELIPVMSTLVLEPQTWENMLRRTEQKSTHRSHMEFVAIG